MKRGHVSEGQKGQHPNAVSGAVQVTAGGTSIDQGRRVIRTHEMHTGTPVYDSPPYVAPTIIECGAIRTDNKVCHNPVRVEGEYCFGHRAGNGAVRG